MGFRYTVFYLANMFLATPPGEGAYSQCVLLRPTAAIGGKGFTSSPGLYVDIAVATVTLSYGSVHP